MVSLIASDEVKGFKRVLDTRRGMFIDILQSVKAARLDVIPPCAMSAWRILKSISKWILESDIESESETGTEFRLMRRKTWKVMLFLRIIFTVVETPSS